MRGYTSPQHQDRAFSAPRQPAFPGKWLAPQGADAAGRQRSGCKLTGPSGASCGGRVFRLRTSPQDTPRDAPRPTGQWQRPRTRRYMSMSIQSQHAVATRLALPPERADVSAHRALLRALILAGARGTGASGVTAALIALLAGAASGQRDAAAMGRRGAARGCAAGETTSRAWLPVALGETEFGAGPRSRPGYLGGTLSASSAVNLRWATRSTGSPRLR